VAITAGGVGRSSYVPVNGPYQVDREKVLSHGKEVVGRLLVDLQVRKSTADGAGARKFYIQLTTPLPGWDKDIRDVVLRKKMVCDLKSSFSIFLLMPNFPFV
jgi:peptidase M49-like protein